MQEYIKERVLAIADYILESKETLRSTANVFMVSKSTVHTDMSERLKEIDLSKYDKVKEVLEFNYSVRHLRGGEATCQKYKKCKSNN